MTIDETYIFEIQFENGSILYLEAESMSEALWTVDESLKDPASNRVAKIRNLPVCRMLWARNRTPKFKKLEIVKD